jgi:sugar/nucleoside kinase (ribokinase family)
VAPDQRSFDLVVIGDVNPDIVVRDANPVFGQREGIVPSIELTVGGSASIMAAAAAKLGLRVALVGVVGDDGLGRFMLDELRARGVDIAACRIDPALPTGASVILTRTTDRAILTSLGTIASLSAADIPASLIASARHVHVASYFLLVGLHAGLPGVVDAAHHAGATVSVDPNWDPAETWDSGLPGLLPRIDVFLPNETEALRVGGASTVDEAARELLAMGAAGVAIKRGDDGAIAMERGGALVSVPAIAVEAVDTVGAGDAFDAAFLAAWQERRPLADCLGFAVVAGALSTRAMGGTAGQATRAEIETALVAARRN